MDYRQQFHISDEYVSVNALPEDPVGCSVFCYQNSNTLGFVKIFPIDREQTMRFGDPWQIIDGIHESLAENQALVQVFEDRYPENRIPCVYSIIKSHHDQPGTGVQYFMRMNLYLEGGYHEVQAFFDEVGMTGVRDTTIFELLLREGSVKLDGDKSIGWWRDPYESGLNRSYLMNRSEEARFDKLFPEHPLSVCRQLAADITGTDPTAPFPALYLRVAAERPDGEIVFATWFERWTYWGRETDAGNGIVLYTDGRLYRVEFSHRVKGKPARYTLLVTDKALAKNVGGYIDSRWTEIAELPDKAEGNCLDGNCDFLRLRSKLVQGYMMYYNIKYGKLLADLRDGALKLIDFVYDTSVFC